MLTMQDALLALTRYWVDDHACLIVQPANTEVGAGTLNPATFLRVLGPEPWRVAYVEPSVRPDDSRYGENPNRVQMHTQFQVILKPEPGNPQELYLGSLRALGIDVDAHDIRFVEDNWASPALGAWGLGWEVWLDGLEITQFTYFQQAGGMALDPVSVELTYGMERILMALQGVSHFKEIAYAPGVSYGELFGEAEYEMSRYYLDDADIATNRALFDMYESEARRMIEARLPVPAHSYVLKCSHAFNVLDARGAVSPTERARAFTRMRGLAHQVAELWGARRAEAGHPLGITLPAAVAASIAPLPTVQVASTLLFEIGVEELPPSEIPRLTQSLHQALAERLAGTRLAHGDIRTYATPRRLVAVVAAVAPREDDHVRQVRGPHMAAAFLPDGTPGKAAQGFARSQGVDVDALERIETEGVEYVAVTKRHRGREAAAVLAEILPEIVAGLRAERNMRWSAPKLSFSRPIRWIVALLGKEVVPFSISSLSSDRITRGHRSADRDTTITLSSADAYLDSMKTHHILLDSGDRHDQIVEAAQRLAAEVNGHVDETAERALIDEVTNLVEQPVAIRGSFDARYLALPADVLTTVMRKHQRYLPIRNAQGGLLPHFVAVANGDCTHDLVRAGNQAVLRARYEDASFFWKDDLTTAPMTMKQGLAALTFEARLGSVGDRATRIATIAAGFAGSLRLTGAERITLDRAAALAKFDLASHMVIELSSLAGVMAREYARQAGEPEAVATALFEMELPRHTGDALPVTTPGALLALADRFDLLAGLFAVGAAPTGSSDPFGMRRAALGLLSILRTRPELATITVDQGVRLAGAAQPVPFTSGVHHDAVEFIRRRYHQLLVDAGIEHDLTQAVLPLALAPRHADQTLSELGRRHQDPQFALLTEALQRAERIVPSGTAPNYDAGVLVDPADLRLHRALLTLRAGLVEGSPDLASFADRAGALIVEPIHRFFNDVLVMDKEPTLRAARLGLLASINHLANDVLDWSSLH